MTRFVILDDSTKEAFKAEVDAFANQYNVRVVRRLERKGFKAGNLNHYLMDADYDFFVILDSDEIIPRNFISRALDYFAHDPHTGIVQANHVATRNRNAFMHTFSAGVDSFWTVFQTVKDRYGFMSLLGHGAMVSRECYVAAGGVPEVVAEDLCLSIASRLRGYYTRFAVDIVCEEEFPVDYGAFRKRHAKWTQGNMEFIRRYTGIILKAKMSWFEKIDIILFAYNMPLTALFTCYIALHVVIMPIVHYQVVYPLWMMIPTLAFLGAPMINEVIYHRRKGVRWVSSYLASSMMLYGSMFVIGLRAALKAAIGGATFIVTPKDSSGVTHREALRLNSWDLIFCIGLSGVSMILTRNILPVLSLTAPALFSVWLTIMHQRSPRRLWHRHMRHASK